MIRGVQISVDDGSEVDARSAQEVAIIGPDGETVALIVPPGDGDVLTDSECAVIFDALAQMRDQIQNPAIVGLDGEGRPTPNIDSALEKLRRGYGPSTQGIRFYLVQP